MENVPVEVIENILSRLGPAGDVVIASATCRKWREAFCRHLHLLSFNSNDWPVYRDLLTSRLEILITQTIFQTSGLQGLAILMDDVDEFSALTVIAWLMYTRESLRRLYYNVRTSPNLEILDNGETAENLDVVDVSNFTIIWPKFYHMISRSSNLRVKFYHMVSRSSNLRVKFYHMVSRSSNLRVLRLWDVVSDDEDDLVYLDTIVICFPYLSHLSLSNDLRDGVIHYGLEGSYLLHNVVVLEVGWTVINDLFSQWLEELYPNRT